MVTNCSTLCCNMCAFQYCVCVGLIFFCELSTGIVIFVYKDWVIDKSLDSCRSSYIFCDIC